MGDVSDAIMEGELCEECGVWINHNYQGFPRSCSDCKPKKSSSKAKRKRKLKRKRERE
jgi:hypothetical protein